MSIVKLNSTAVAPGASEGTSMGTIVMWGLIIAGAAYLIYNNVIKKKEPEAAEEKK